MDASDYIKQRRQRMVAADVLGKRTSFNEGCRAWVNIQLNGNYESTYKEVNQGTVGLTPAEYAIILLNADCNPSTPPPPPPTPSDYTFFTYTTYESQPNYYYRLYLPATETWTDLIDSGFSTADYSYYDSSGNNQKDFYVMYQKDNVMYVQFLSGTDIVRTITFSTANNYSHESNKTCFYYWTKESTDYILGLYVFATDTLYETTLTVEDSTTVRHDYLLTESVALFIRNNNTDETTAYNFNSSSTPSSLFTATSADFGFRSTDTTLFGTTRDSDTDYYINVFKITNAGADIYTLPAETYDSRSHRIFGLNGLNYYSRFFNPITELYDFYVFPSSTPFSSPIIKTDISNNNDTYYFSDNINITRQYNHLIISEYYPIMNYIADGAGDMFDNGNYIDITGTSSATSFGATNIYYDTLVQEATYGYTVGGPISRPHTSVAFTDSGSLRWTAHGEVGSDGNATVVNYEGTYTTAGGRTGKYWMNVNYNAGDPSIGDLWFTIERPSWGSSTTLVEDTRKTSDTNNYSHYVEVTGTNYIFCKALLSASGAQFIAQANTEAFLSSYVNDMVITDATFSNISLTNFVNWQDATGNTYTSLIPNWYNYNYDGPGDIPFLHNASVHVLIDGASSFTTYNFLRTNTTTNTIGLNQDTVCIPWSNGSDYLSKMITTTGSSDTILRNSTTNFNSSTIYIMKHAYFHTVYNGSATLWFYIKNDNTLLDADSTTEEFNVNTAGDVALIRYNTNNMASVIYDGGFYILGSYFDNVYNIYPDLGQSIIFAFRRDDSENNVLILTETGPQYQTVPILDDYSATMATDDYIVFYKSNPHTIYIVTRDAQVYSLITSINTTGNYSIYNTDKDTLIYYTDSDTNLRSYTVFSRGTNTFSTITEPSTLSNWYSVYSNYPYQSFD